MDDILELGEVPFYWRVKQGPNQDPCNIPTHLPFSFAFMESLQLVIQKRNPQVLEWLNRVYKEDANVGYLQDGHALAESYGGEFIDFFRHASELLTKQPESAADIGCGGTYLLQKVREQGLSVKGIDPSPVTLAAGVRAGIEIVQEFYPSPRLTERFDILFHYDVLEHIEDPVSFLHSHHANLTPHGAIIFAVPDCSHHIQLGDISMLLHEHLNYFDKESLDNVVRAAGFNPLIIKSAAHGGVLLCCAIALPDASKKQEEYCGGLKFHDFCKKAKKAIKRFKDLAVEFESQELGFYVPLRAFPYLAQLPRKIKPRFFDDDPGLHRRYFDGFNVQIENFMDLVERPTSQLLICTVAFGDQILNRLKKTTLPGIVIHKWVDLFD